MACFTMSSDTTAKLVVHDVVAAHGYRLDFPFLLALVKMLWWSSYELHTRPPPGNIKFCLWMFYTVH